MSTCIGALHDQTGGKQSFVIFLGKHSGTTANVTVAEKFGAEENTEKTSERHSERSAGHWRRK